MINVDRNTSLNINLRSLNENYKIICKKVGKKCIVAATVKANAYGLGSKEIVSSLMKAGCNFLKSAKLSKTALTTM